MISLHPDSFRYPYMSRLFVFLILLSMIPLSVAAKAEVLATVGDTEVTDTELERAINSSPFATQFVAMDEDDQAALRGDLLQRLVASRLLLMEAKRLKLDQSEEYKRNFESFRLGLLYKHYLDSLRDKVKVPPEEMQRLKKEFAGNADALEAAKSAYISNRYRQLRKLTIQSLRDRFHVKVHEARLDGDPAPDTVLLEGDEDLKILYRDLVDGVALDGKPSREWLEDRLYRRAELLLIAKAAEKEGVDIEQKLSAFAEERLPALLVERKEQEWVGDEKVLRDYLKEHPDLAVVPERRHIGQIVLKTREEAEAVRKRILAGESLFTLAGEMSIDPYGRSRNGDMGWIKAGTGLPALEKAVAELKDNEISEIVETPRGFHIITILERRPGGVRSFAGVKDRVRQVILDQKLADYVNSLGEKYKVVWNVVKAEK